MQSHAERLAEKLGNDGQDFSRFDCVIEATTGVRWVVGVDSEYVLYEFEDGSVIVDMGEYWDVGTEEEG